MDDDITETGGGKKGQQKGGLASYPPVASLHIRPREGPGVSVKSSMEGNAKKKNNSN